MRLLFLISLLILALCIPYTLLLAGENHPAKEVIRDTLEGWKGTRPYWEHPDYIYPYPHHYPYSNYPYPYYPYPPPPYQRYEESRKSPYDSLSVKQAGRISIVVQPLDAKVFVDGYQLKQKDDLTYEIGLLTGLHKVEVKREGYKPHSIEVLVEAGKTVSLAIELKNGKVK